MFLNQHDEIRNFFVKNNYSFEENYRLGEISLHKLGGNIEYYVSVFDEESLIKLFTYLCSQNINHFIVGEANGTIVSDNGYKGVAVSLDGSFRNFSFDGNKIHACSAVTLHSLFNEARINSLSGFEFLSSIPSSLGAAIVYKIHAFGKNILDKMINVRMLEIKNREAVISEYSRDEYLNTTLEKGKFVILSACFQLEEAGMEKIEKNIDRYRYINESITPSDVSIGIVFEQKSYNINEEEIRTHEMIEKAGMLNAEYNGAKWYKRFPNYIMLNQNTKANDVYKLVNESSERIKKYYKAGINLYIEFIGDFQ